MSKIEDIPNWKAKCTSTGHNPPTHICIPYGKQLKHVCPTCGNITVIQAPNITL